MSTRRKIRALSAGYNMRKPGSRMLTTSSSHSANTPPVRQGRAGRAMARDPPSECAGGECAEELRSGVDTNRRTFALAGCQTRDERGQHGFEQVETEKEQEQANTKPILVFTKNKNTICAAINTATAPAKTRRVAC